MKERRCCQRLATELLQNCMNTYPDAIQVRCTFIDEPIVYSGTLKNISINGIALYSPVILDPATEMTISCNFNKYLLLTKVYILWVDELPGGCVAGAEFVDISSLDRNIVKLLTGNAYKN